MGRMHAEAALRFKPRCVIVIDLGRFPAAVGARRP